MMRSPAIYIPVVQANHRTNLLLAGAQSHKCTDIRLTKTDTELALGMSTIHTTRIHDNAFMLLKYNVIHRIS